MTAVRDHRAVALIVASALFMQNLDSAVLATALPSMARDLNEDPARLGAAITSYLVALTVFIPFSSWIADRFGAKRVFMMAILIFVFASVLCGRSQGLGELIACRILQGFGGAMMVPVGRLLLLREIPKKDMLSAMAWLTMPALLGPVTGPPVGGILTDLFSWRAVFWINVPIGLIGFALVAWKIPPVAPTKPGPPDLVGLGLTGAALALVMFGIETVGRHVVPEVVSWAGLALGLVAGGFAIRHCRRVPRPALDLSLFSIATFRDPAVAGSIFRSGAGAVPFLIPVMLQIGFGMSASQSGLVSFATALGAFAMKPLVRPLLQAHRLPWRADGQWRGGGGGHRGAGAGRADLAVDRDLRAAGGRRAGAQPAIHRAEHARLRRCADRADVGGDGAVRHLAAVDAGAWAWCWRRPRWRCRPSMAGRTALLPVRFLDAASWWRRWWCCCRCRCMRGWRRMRGRKCPDTGADVTASAPAMGATGRAAEALAGAAPGQTAALGPSTAPMQGAWPRGNGATVADRRQALARQAKPGR